MKKIIVTIITACIITSCGVKLPETMSKEEFKALNDGLYAEMQTSKGTMTIELFEKETPLTVANFVGLAEGSIENEAKPLGTPFYDGIIFHRVIKDFMIQGGDPDGKGTGGPGYKFEDEFVDSLKHDKKGVLSMANSGPNTNGSQFFITEVATPWLNGKHSVFGEVIEGLEVIDTIANVKKGGQDKPKQDIVIEKLTIVRKGDDYKNYNGAEAFKKAKVEHQAKLEEKKRLEKLAIEQEIVRQKEFTEKAETTESGLKYVIIENGTGAVPTKGDDIQVHYTLRTADGKKVDSSYDRNQPLPIKVGKTGLIEGWLEAIELFPRGSKVMVIVPPSLGYGAQGAGGGVIPPNATLYFDMEILE